MYTYLCQNSDIIADTGFGIATERKRSPTVYLMA
jgi:hypothetical protein